MVIFFNSSSDILGVTGHTGQSLDISEFWGEGGNNETISQETRNGKFYIVLRREGRIIQSIRGKNIDRAVSQYKADKSIKKGSDRVFLTNLIEENTRIKGKTDAFAYRAETGSVKKKFKYMVVVKYSRKGKEVFGLSRLSDSDYDKKVVRAMNNARTRLAAKRGFGSDADAGNKLIEDEGWKEEIYVRRYRGR